MEGVRHRALRGVGRSLVSRDKPSRAERLGLYLPCPRCQAKPMEWCFTNGKLAVHHSTHLHLNRVQPACIVHDMGVTSGKRVFPS